eukprot:TRINITY_DN103591_c0_g1_i1.p1 TRINITY_DN103591_c0_g1~~TRINITY_DN103591_c0_g1_i1.p1  ORF type:complete len:252 (+),score=34.76 TRINITY_DN103591_c0_g1_i1:46-756(+)
MELFGKRGLLTNFIVIMLIAVVLLRAMWSNRNLSEALAFYGAYHQDPVNQAIHFVFVPLLLWSFLGFFAHIPVLGQEWSLPGGHPVSYASVIALAYICFYCLLDPITGPLYSLVIAGMYLSAVQILQADRRTATKRAKDEDHSGSSASYAWRLFALVQVLGWYMQLHPGHAVFEGVKPALLDSLGQSFSVAPLFAFYEGVWAAGLRSDLRDQTASLVALQRAEMCKTAGAAFRFCS